MDEARITIRNVRIEAHTLKSLSGEYTQEQYDEEYSRQIIIESIKELRQERNRRIAQTDYLFTSDFPHATPEKKQEWFEYRQALRDLPTATEDPVNPVWPVAPTP